MSHHGKPRGDHEKISVKDGINPLSSPLLYSASEQTAGLAKVFYPISDDSPEARKFRTRVFMGALCGEFVGTFLLFWIIYSVSVETGAHRLYTCLSAGCAFIPLCYSFADISGSHFNPAVSFACRVSGKLSNRKCAGYIMVQLLASTLACVLVNMVNSSGQQLTEDFIVINPETQIGKLFMCELMYTFFFVFTIFALAFDLLPDSQGDDGMAVKDLSNDLQVTVYTPSPRTKAGFAPLCIGLCLISCALCGGVFNPARVFGPALATMTWGKATWVIFLADFIGAGAAAAMQHFFTTEFALAHQAINAIDNRSKQKRRFPKQFFPKVPGVSKAASFVLPQEPCGEVWAGATAPDLSSNYSNSDLTSPKRSLNNSRQERYDPVLAAATLPSAHKSTPFGSHSSP
eukprot:gb/GEZN01006367.1/.p1 GENE.gb/GEZN01006367.1/~~gb/GEZN01006367.1/.p1  ORF type:complete len:402 (-),score=51.34 gb/GEZN01006367.1/:447-1652(-)